MVGGLVMVGAIELNKSPVNLSQVTPIARLTAEYDVIVVPGASKIQSLKDLVAQLKANPGSVSWAGGSAGGHNGLTSIIEYLGSSDFARLRIGISKDTGSANLSGFVLSTFKKAEEAILDEVMETSADCCERWVKDGVECAANQFNLKNRKEGR